MYDIDNNSTNMRSIRFHLLVHPTKFVGDKNQLLGTVEAFKHITHFNSNAIEAKEWNYTDPQALTQLGSDLSASPKVQHVILSSGEQGLIALRHIRVDKPVLSIWSAHQHFPEIKETTDKINIIALPSYAISPAFRDRLPKEIALVETMGVAHTVTPESIEKAFTDWQSNPVRQIKKSDNYIAVVLGGDATVNGVQKYFSVPEANLLAGYVSELAKKNNAHVLVTNAPRTGVGVSESFINILKINKIEHQFFGFVPNTPSAYQPMLGALVANPANIAIVTADSASMVCEMNAVLKCKLMLANVDSTDNAFLNYAKEKGLAFSVIHFAAMEASCSVEELKQTGEQIKESAGLTIATTIEQQLTIRMHAANQSTHAIHFFASRRNGVNASSADSTWRYGRGNVFSPDSQHAENTNATQNTDAILKELKLETDHHPGVILQSQYGKGISVVNDEFLANAALPRDSFNRIVINGDGLFTTLPNVPLLNKSGDAHPIVFKSEKAIGIIVGSWKCLGKDIINWMLDLFKGNDIDFKDITVYIGPGLGSDSYSIGNPTRKELTDVFGDAVTVATRLKHDGSKYILDVCALMQEYSRSFGFTVDFIESSNTFNKTEWKLMKKKALEEKNPLAPLRYYERLPFFGARQFARAVRLACRIAEQNGLPLPPELTTLQGDLKNIKTAATQGRYNETGRCLNGVMKR